MGGERQSAFSIDPCGLSVLLLATVVASCGARSDTVSEEERAETDCAAADQRLQDQCQKQCAAAPASSPQNVASRDVKSNACVESCIGESTKQCEATASCRCSLALTKLANLEREALDESSMK